MGCDNYILQRSIKALDHLKLYENDIRGTVGDKIRFSDAIDCIEDLLKCMEEYAHLIKCSHCGSLINKLHLNKEQINGSCAILCPCCMKVIE